MPYAEGRTYYDADSHLMELSDWLETYADPDVREQLRPLYLGGAGKLADEAVRAAEARRGDAAAAAELAANVMGPKGWSALGAFDPAERSTRSISWASTSSSCSDLRARRSSRATTSTCSTAAPGPTTAAWSTSARRQPPAPGRLRAAGRRRAGRRGGASRRIDLGCGAVLVPSAPPQDKSPTHPDYDRVWAQLQDADVPFMLHIGGGGRPLRQRVPRQRQAGHHRLPRRRREHPLEGLHGVAAPARDLPVVMVLDGVLEEFPRLKGGCIEQGACGSCRGCVGSTSPGTFRKTEPALRAAADGRATTCTANCGSRRSRPSRSAG